MLYVGEPAQREKVVLHLMQLHNTLVAKCCNCLRIAEVKNSELMYRKESIIGFSSKEEGDIQNYLQELTEFIWVFMCVLSNTDTVPMQRALLHSAQWQ